MEIMKVRTTINNLCADLQKKDENHKWHCKCGVTPNGDCHNEALLDGKALKEFKEDLIFNTLLPLYDKDRLKFKELVREIFGCFKGVSKQLEIEYWCPNMDDVGKSVYDAQQAVSGVFIAVCGMFEVLKIYPRRVGISDTEYIGRVIGQINEEAGETQESDECDSVKTGILPEVQATPDDAECAECGNSAPQPLTTVQVDVSEAESTKEEKKEENIKSRVFALCKLMGDKYTNTQRAQFISVILGRNKVEDFTKDSNKKPIEDGTILKYVKDYSREDKNWITRKGVKSQEDAKEILKLLQEK